MILFIDNYDSFTYNLVDVIGQQVPEIAVYRNDALNPKTLRRLSPEAIVISPGPGTPSRAGISSAVIRRWYREIPILGVCLGHQCMAEAFGARIIRAAEPVHGKTSPVFHRGHALFTGVPSPFPAGRYHSLIIDRQTLPPGFDVIAATHEGIIMAIQHREAPLIGVQFHPESVLTPHGPLIIRNWLEIVKRFRHGRTLSAINTGRIEP